MLQEKIKIRRVAFSISDHPPAATAFSNCLWYAIEDCLPSKVGALFFVEYHCLLYIDGSRLSCLEHFIFYELELTVKNDFSEFRYLIHNQIKIFLLFGQNLHGIYLVVNEFLTILRCLISFLTAVFVVRVLFLLVVSVFLDVLGNKFFILFFRLEFD